MADCSICQTSFPWPNIESAIRLSCNHVFGEDCILQWLQLSTSNGCPLCRTRITSAADIARAWDLDMVCEDARWRQDLVEWTPASTKSGASGSDIPAGMQAAEQIFQRLSYELLDWLDLAEDSEEWLCVRLPIVMSVVQSPTLSNFADVSDKDPGLLLKAAPIYYPMVKRLLRDMECDSIYPDADTFRRLAAVHERIEESRNRVYRRLYNAEVPGQRVS